MSEWREDWEAIQTFGLLKVLYWRFVYQRHMRFLHKRGRHKMKHYGPLLPDGGEFDKCDWCGHTENFTSLTLNPIHSKDIGAVDDRAERFLVHRAMQPDAGKESRC